LNPSPIWLHSQPNNEPGIYIHLGWHTLNANFTLKGDDILDLRQESMRFSTLSAVVLSCTDEDQLVEPGFLERR